MSQTEKKQRIGKRETMIISIAVIVPLLMIFGILIMPNIIGTFNEPKCGIDLGTTKQWDYYWGLIWTPCDANPQHFTDGWIDQYYFGNWNNYDRTQHTCKSGFVEFFWSGTSFQCVTKQEAQSNCMSEYPTDYKIENGEVYKRTIDVSNMHTVCATNVGIVVGVNSDTSSNITFDEYQKMRQNGNIVGDGSN